jgi:hypothetical protein
MPICLGNNKLSRRDKISLTTGETSGTNKNQFSNPDRVEGIFVYPAPVASRSYLN